MPLDVDFISFNDVKEKGLNGYDVVINAGFEGSAWSGGEAWDDEVVAKLNEWVYSGGAFIGVNDPSALRGYDTFFRMAQVLGVDKDTGEKICHGRYTFDVEGSNVICDGTEVDGSKDVYITDGETKVLLSDNGMPSITVHDFGKGKGVYLSSFRHNEVNNRTLLNLILMAAGESIDQNYLTDNVYTECCYYPEGKQLVVINNSEQTQTTTVKTEFGNKVLKIEGFDTAIVEL